MDLVASKFRLFMISAFTFVSVGAHAAIDVNELNRDLTASKATWTARDTAISRMSVDDLKRMTGLQQEGLFEDVDFDSPFENDSPVALPSKFDWRDREGQNWVTPIKDQGNCGSCVTFAAVATMETQMRIASGFSTLPVNLSTQALLSCGGRTCTFGWWPGFAARYLRDVGVPDDACLPYESGVTGKAGSCASMCADAEKRRVKIASFTRPTVLFGNLNKVKRELLKGPLMTAMLIFEDFAAYGTGVYRHRKGGLVSAHAVSIVGYDDSTQSFIMRNSWGDQWGENGFFRIAYDDLSGAGRMTWAFQMPSPRGVESLMLPEEDTYASGTLPFDVRSTYAGTSGHRVVVYDSKSRPMYGVTCTTCEKRLDVSRWTDGRYELAVAAVDGSGQELGHSLRKAFYVVNHKPTLSLSFKATHGTDLSKPVSGRVEFEVQTGSTASAPLTSMAFHYRSVAAKQDVAREATVVRPVMTTGWRTTSLPNGAYEIWFSGRLKTDAFDERIETARTLVTVRN